MKMFGELRLVRVLSDEQIAAMRDLKLAATTKLPHIEAAVKAGGFLTGTPADIIEQRRRWRSGFPASIAWCAACRSAPRSPRRWNTGPVREGGNAGVPPHKGRGSGRIRY
jgi:hypothetical protein